MINESKIEKAMRIISNMDRKPQNLEEIKEWFINRAELTTTELESVQTAFEKKIKSLGNDVTQL